jgi:sugar phosphate isomerase/epimerase
MSQETPIVGAAMRSVNLPQFRDWLLEKQRDLEIQDAAYPDFLDGEWQPVVNDIRTQLDGYTGRVGIHAPFYSLPIAAMDSKVRAAVIERFTQAIDFCAGIGGSHMVLHSPIQFLGTPFLDEMNTPEMRMFQDMFHKTLDPIVTLAQRHGITLVIENIFDKDPAVLVGLVRQFDSEYVRVSIDAGHAYVNHKLGAPTPDYWILAAGAHLGHVHLQDTDGYADRHWSIGDGEIKWRSVFATLGQVAAQPRLILEVRPEDITRSWQWLVAHGLAR